MPANKGIIKFNPQEVIQKMGGLDRRKLTRPFLKRYLIFFFEEVRRMNPHMEPNAFIKHDDDLLVFIFFDESEKRSKYNREIDRYIQMLATIYFYTGHELALDQLVILLLNRIWFRR